MRCIVEGYGSIGARHAGILKELGHDVVCVSKRIDMPYPVFDSVRQALNEAMPDLYLIATRTADHKNSLSRLEALGYSGVVLIEKPVTNFLAECSNEPSCKTYIAYNMRLHPIIEKMKAVLGNESPVSASLSVGQYLPEWRTGRVYSQTYSAIRAQGGGVLRDLSHELDLAQYFFGPCKKVSGRMGKYSNLDIDTEDWVDLLLVMKNCPAVTIHLDYLDRNPHRDFVIHTNTRTISADLWHSMLTINGKTESFKIERNDSFRKQLRKILAGDCQDLCTWAEGVHVMEIINAAENSSAQSRWVTIT